MKKTYRIKTNNQELLISKENEFDATSRWLFLPEFQKTRLYFKIDEDIPFLGIINRRRLQMIGKLFLIQWMTENSRNEKNLETAGFIEEQKNLCPTAL